MRQLIIIAIILTGVNSMGQSITLGSRTSLHIGSSSSFFFGGHTTINGPIDNQGEIISYSDIDFGNNRLIGHVRFVGPADQTLTGDTLVTGNFTVDKVGNLILSTSQVRVRGSMNLINGATQSEEADDLILVSGRVDDSGDGYVEGRLTAITGPQPITFPMGINGFRNHLTLSNAETDKIIVVVCRVPDPDSLIPDKDMIGISDEVEWVVTCLNDSISGEFSAEFSGLDLQNFSNGDFIRANDYDPALVTFIEGDTSFHALSSETANISDDRTSGNVESRDQVQVPHKKPRRFAIALIPVQVGPVFFIPNTFAPTASFEENQVFRPFFSGAEISSISISIFDSFNNEVFAYNDSGTDLDIALSSWDGTLSSGLDAPDGVYYYSIKIVAESQVYDKSGSVLLMK